MYCSLLADGLRNLAVLVDPILLVVLVALVDPILLVVPVALVDPTVLAGLVDPIGLADLVVQAVQTVPIQAAVRGFPILVVPVLVLGILVHPDFLNKIILTSVHGVSNQIIYNLTISIL